MSIAHSPIADKTDPAHTLLHRRYGTDQPFEPDAWNDSLETILSHRTVRTYLPKPVPDEIVRLAVSAAQSAPTSSNLQAWSVVAVRDPQRRAALADLAAPNPQILSAPLFLLWIADLSRLRKITVQHGNSGEGLDYLESFLLASVDAALAAQNALVAFESLGLGTCYIGGMRNHPAEVGKLLNLPPEAFAVFGMTVGYPDPGVETDIKPRLPQSAVLHHEQYGETSAKDALSGYDDTLRAFQKGQGMAVRGWSEVVAARVADKAALKGRDLLTGIARQMGFKIR
ncbi:NADPH-dependent oxidoreductase [Neorhizobium sp. BT27B]|uniref:NADPH-dependent oxidoreductase n=1 Tax=Neorhizobium sp. BT27B TaxID=3142625 RepID=UPI003D2BBEDC